MEKLRTKLTYPHVISTLALFVALGGTAIAAFELPEDSVKSKHIAPGAVKSPDVLKNSLTGHDIDEPTLKLPEGPQGPQGPQGPTGPAGSPDTPQQVLDKIKQVDGPPSGLDADLLDGQSAGDFLGGPVIVRTQTATIPTNGIGTSFPHAACAAGEVAVSGGFSSPQPFPAEYDLDHAGPAVMEPDPFIGAFPRAAQAGETPTAWFIRFHFDTISNPSNPTVEIYVLCVKAT